MENVMEFLPSVISGNIVYIVSPYAYKPLIVNEELVGKTTHVHINGHVIRVL